MISSCCKNWFLLTGTCGHPFFTKGYDNPQYRIEDQGGMFTGIGRMHAACNVPNDMQPSTPPGGLFGPGANPPLWGNPGYSPPSDITWPGNFGGIPDPIQSSSPSMRGHVKY